MLSDYQLITALHGVFALSKEAKKAGIRLVAQPRTTDDDLQEMNHGFDITRYNIETGFYVQVGMGTVSLDFFDGDASTEHARMSDVGFATAMMEFVSTMVDTVLAMAHNA